MGEQLAPPMSLPRALYKHMGMAPKQQRTKLGSRLTLRHFNGKA